MEGEIGLEMREYWRRSERLYVLPHLGEHVGLWFAR